MIIWISVYTDFSHTKRWTYHFPLCHTSQQNKWKRGKKEESTLICTKLLQVPWEVQGRRRTRSMAFPLVYFSITIVLVFFITQGFNSISKVKGGGVKGRKINLPYWICNCHLLADWWFCYLHSQNYLTRPRTRETKQKRLRGGNHKEVKRHISLWEELLGLRILQECLNKAGAHRDQRGTSKAHAKNNQWGHLPGKVTAKKQRTIHLHLQR